LNLGPVSEHSGARGHHPCRGLYGLLTQSGNAVCVAALVTMLIFSEGADLWLLIRT